MSICSANPIPDHIKQEMLSKGSYQQGCPVAMERLSLVTVSYIDFSGTVHHDGEIVVLDVVADRVAKIFNDLYEQKFPIAKIRRIEHYDADDEKSLIDNNTAAFNCRKLTGDDTKYSIHSYGLAIDINPIQNPYVHNQLILPPEGENYLDRTDLRVGMVEPIVDVFTRNGFTIWGSVRPDRVDYQHFQLPNQLAEQLARLSFADGFDLIQTE